MSSPYRDNWRGVLVRFRAPLPSQLNHRSNQKNKHDTLRDICMTRSLASGHPGGPNCSRAAIDMRPGSIMRRGYALKRIWTFGYMFILRLKHLFSKLRFTPPRRPMLRCTWLTESYHGQVLTCTRRVDAVQSNTRRSHLARVDSNWNVVSVGGSTGVKSWKQYQRCHRLHMQMGRQVSSRGRCPQIWADGTWVQD